MKLVPILTLLICLQLGFWLFDATASSSGQFLANTSSSNSSFGLTSNATTPFGNGTVVNLWDVVLNPTMIGDSSFVFLLLGLVGISAALAVGTYLFFKIDAIILFPVFTALLGFGSIPIIELYNLIGRETPGLFGCVQGTGIVPGVGLCLPVSIMQVLCVSILGIWWLWACIDFWVNHSSS